MKRINQDEVEDVIRLLKKNKKDRKLRPNTVCEMRIGGDYALKLISFLRKEKLPNRFTTRE